MLVLQVDLIWWDVILLTQKSFVTQMEKTTSNERSHFENPVTSALWQTYALKSTTDSIYMYLLLELPSSKLDTANARADGTGTSVRGNSTALFQDLEGG
jgi:hypothetical protein